MLIPQKIDYSAMINKGAKVVDVRTQEEFISGHAKGSENIPLHELSNHIDKLKGQEVILVCRSGGRAAQAKSILEKNNIISHNAGAWQNL